MDFETFVTSLDSAEPPAAVDGVLLALWKAGKGDWEAAHSLVQDDPGTEAAWVHAYLHRQEGDLYNASYWYRQAGKPVYEGDLNDEWRNIVSSLLSD